MIEKNFITKLIQKFLNASPTSCNYIVVVPINLVTIIKNNLKSFLRESFAIGYMV